VRNSQRCRIYIVDITLELAPPSLLCPDYMDFELIVDEDHSLISGRHRLEAVKRLGLSSVKVQVYRYASTAAKLRHAVSENIQHGLPYSMREKREIGIRMYREESSIEDISGLLAVTPRTVRSWTKPERDAKRESLAGQVQKLDESGMTQEEIARELGVTRHAVRSRLGGNGNLSKTAKELKDIPAELPEDDATTERATPTDNETNAVQDKHTGDSRSNHPHKPRETADDGPDVESTEDSVQSDGNLGEAESSEDVKEGDVAGEEQSAVEEIRGLVAGATADLRKAEVLLTSMRAEDAEIVAELEKTYEELKAGLTSFVKAWSRATGRQ